MIESWLVMNLGDKIGTVITFLLCVVSFGVGLRFFIRDLRAGNLSIMNENKDDNNSKGTTKR